MYMPRMEPSGKVNDDATPIGLPRGVVGPAPDSDGFLLAPARPDSASTELSGGKVRTCRLSGHRRPIHQRGCEIDFRAMDVSTNLRVELHQNLDVRDVKTTDGKSLTFQRENDNPLFVNVILPRRWRRQNRDADLQLRRASGE